MPRTLIIATFIFVGSPAALGQQSVCDSVRGDVNLDGQANIFDVQCHILVTVNELAGLSHSSSVCGATEESEVDQNCDYSVNIIDVYMTIQAALGQAWSPLMDGDNDGCADRCETVVFECEEGWMNPHCDLMIGPCIQSSCADAEQCVEVDGGPICTF